MTGFAFELAVAASPLLNRAYTIVTPPDAAVGPGTPLEHYLRLAAFLVLVLLTGFTFQEATRRRTRCLEGERVATTIAGGLSLLVVGGLLLNLFASGLTSFAWLRFLFAALLVTGLISFVRRASNASPMPRRPRGKKHLRPLDLAFFGVALLLVVGGFWVDGRSVVQTGSDRFLQLWVLPEGGKSQSVLRIGVGNLEAKPVTLMVRAELMHSTLNTWGPLDLAPREQWQTKFDVAGRAGRIRVEIFRPGTADGPLRTVSYTLGRP